MELEAWIESWKRKGRFELNEILWRDWNPIGVEVPEDEYSGYAGGMARLLREGADESALAEYLERSRVDHIGLEPDPQGDRKIAERVARWYHEAMLAQSGQ